MSEPTPVVNVNLTPCDCDGPHPGITGSTGAHANDCATRPVLVPCPIPRSFTVVVRLGECACPVSTWRKNAATRTAGSAHDTSCPARPISVACSISGTWAESEVTDGYTDTTSGQLAALERELSACRARWALVKALVTGQDMSALDLEARHVGTFEMFAQRDAVFAALTDMVRAEDLAFAAQIALDKAMGLKRNVTPFHRPDSEREAWPSAAFLAAYVERLIEQVGVLGVEP